MQVRGFWRLQAEPEKRMDWTALKAAREWDAKVLFSLTHCIVEVVLER